LKVKGILITSTKEYIRKKYGEESWEKILDVLPQDKVKALNRVLLPGGLYDQDIYISLNKAIVDVIGKGDESFLETVGAETAEESIKLYDIVFKRKLKTPEETLEGLVPLLADTLFEGLTPDVKIGKGYGEYTLTGEPLKDGDFTKILLLRSIGWIRKVFEKIGTPITKLEHETGETEKAPYIKFKIWWE
jgi:hypothetical protein